MKVFSAAASGALVDEKASNYLSVLLKFPLSDAATPVIGVRGLKESGDANRPRSAPPGISAFGLIKSSPIVIPVRFIQSDLPQMPFPFRRVTAQIEQSTESFS